MFDFDEEPYEEQHRRFAVAVGADVTLELEGVGCHIDDEQAPDELHACLPERLTTVEDIRLSSSGVFELGTVSLTERFAVDGELHIDLSARAPGETRLVIDYVDVQGEAGQLTYLLEAAEITHVEHAVDCGGPADSLTRLPVSAGAEFLWQARAFAELTPLATGSMELIENYGGFEIPEPPLDDGGRWVRAPMATGTYVWELMGPGSEPLRFIVYDPSELELELHAAEGEAGVLVQPAVGGDLVCVYEGEGRALVEVASGDCELVVGAFAIDGALPIGVSEATVPLELSGRDTCRVRATLDGAEFEGRVSIDNLPPGPEAGTGESIGATSNEIWPRESSHETCDEIRNVSRGRCTIVDSSGNFDIDGDCLLSAHWDLRHVDGTDDHTQVPGSVVGVGLSSELQARVRYKLLGLEIGNYNPNELTADVSPQGGLTIDNRGCEGSWGGLSITPSASGSYDLTLDAKNADGSKTRSIEARDVAHTTFTTDAVEELQQGGVTTAYYFVGSEMSVALGYEASDGATLGGVAPWLGSVSGGATPTARYDRLHTGTNSGTVRLQSAVTADEYVVEVLDEASITGVRGFDDTEVFGITCIEVAATNEQGLAIHGQAPVRPRLALSGDDALVVHPHTPGAGDAELCVEGSAPGSAQLELRWGAVDQVRTFTVE